MNEFFDDLGSRLAGAASERGAEVEAPVVEGPVAQEILELARVAAHTQERRFAPIACYLAGVAAERFRQARPDLDAASVAAYIRDVRTGLEATVSE